MERVHVTIRGRVQGVGFRWFVQREAQALGLSGWVANRPDGAVEAEVEGTRAALERLLERLRSGPAGARIGGVETQWSEGPARHPGFEIRPTS